MLWRHEFAPLANRVDEIVQFGGLVGVYKTMADGALRGPNAALLNLIILYRATQEQWTQLLGPQEILALNFPDEWTNTDSNRILRRRWLMGEEGSFQVAAVNKERLVTHGGLTHGLWVDLGRPATPQETAQALQERYEKKLWFGNSYRLTGKPSFRADPVFADPLQEVYPSWITADEPMPFSQVHTAGGPNTIQGRALLSESGNMLKHLDGLEHTAFGSVSTVGSATLLAVSPEIPLDKKVKALKAPWRAYVEKVPVVDMRDEEFLEDDE